MSDQMSIQEQILALKMVTAQTGVLHEAQVQQLKLWPWVVFPEHITDYEIGVQPDTDQRYLEYRMKGLDGIKALPKKGCSLLTAWVKELLGSDWTVVIKFNGVEVSKAEELIKIKKSGRYKKGKTNGRKRKGNRRKARRR